MKANDDKTVHYYNEFQRTRYFQGMLLNDDDFKSEQNYQAGKRRLLNRMLHGAGIVCGLDVLWDDKSRLFSINPGLALDCQGNEIWVNHKVTINFDQMWPVQKLHTTSSPCEKSESQSKKYHLIVCYDEKETDPVQVYLPGSSCQENNCNNSRIKEGYYFKLIEGGDCQLKVTEELCNKRKIQLACPDCERTDQPCSVILHSFNSDASGNYSDEVSDECRQYVISGRMIGQMIVSLMSFQTKQQFNNPIAAFCNYISEMQSNRRFDETAKDNVNVPKEVERVVDTPPDQTKAKSTPKPKPNQKKSSEAEDDNA